MNCGCRQGCTFTFVRNGNWLWPESQSSSSFRIPLAHLLTWLVGKCIIAHKTYLVNRFYGYFLHKEFERVSDALCKIEQAQINLCSELVCKCSLYKDTIQTSGKYWTSIFMWCFRKATPFMRAETYTNEYVSNWSCIQKDERESKILWHTLE